MNLSPFENVFNALVNLTKQICYQRTFDRKMVYIRADNVLASFFSWYTKKELVNVGPKGEPMATPRIYL